MVAFRWLRGWLLGLERSPELYAGDGLTRLAYHAWLCGRVEKFLVPFFDLTVCLGRR